MENDQFHSFLQQFAERLNQRHNTKSFSKFQNKTSKKLLETFFLLKVIEENIDEIHYNF